MSDPAPVPVPNEWKSRDIGPVGTAVLVLLLAATIFAFVYACQRNTHGGAPSPVAAAAPIDTPPPAPQPYTKIRVTTSEGGTVHDKSEGHGGTISGDGDKVSLKDFNQSVPTAGLTDTGTATGGGQSGSVSASLSSLNGIRLYALLGALACGLFAFLKLRQVPPDLHHALGLGAGALGCLLVAANPALLYVGLIGLGIAAVVHFWPSIAASKLLSASHVWDDFVNANPSVKAQFDQYVNNRSTSTVTEKDRATLNAITRSNQ